MYKSDIVKFSYLIPFAVPLIAMETHGSNCFYQSIAANPGPFGPTPKTPSEGVKLLHDSKSNVNYVRLPKLTSRASSLGASWPSPGAVKLALDRKGGTECVCVSDEMAMQTGLKFAGTCSTPVSQPNILI